MDVLPSTVKTNDAEFRSNREYHSALTARLKEHLQQAKQGGGEKTVQRHRERGKHLPPGAD